MGFAGSDAYCVALFPVILPRLLRDNMCSALMTESLGYFTTGWLGGVNVNSTTETKATITITQDAILSKQIDGENLYNEDTVLSKLTFGFSVAERSAIVNVDSIVITLK